MALSVACVIVIVSSEELLLLRVGDAEFVIKILCCFVGRSVRHSVGRSVGQPGFFEGRVCVVAESG